MSRETRMAAFAELGRFLRLFTDDDSEMTEREKEQAAKLSRAVDVALQHNGWFSKNDIFFNLKHWGNQLTTDHLERWLSRYNWADRAQKTVAIIMAGNIPLVGFHDFLCVLLSGHKALVKLSSKDKHLLPVLRDFLARREAEFASAVEFTDDRLEKFDAVIATGSNNTARYFAYYFAEKPHIIRKNRNSVAVLTGEEKEETLKKLGEDIFRYYGLGCRNVSKLFVPKGYDFEVFFKAIYAENPVIHHHKYANNYDYNKAVYLMSEFEILDNGFLLLKEDEKQASPIACLFYEYYETPEQLRQHFIDKADQMQCILSAEGDFGKVRFGESQCPALEDYADNVDTLEFLVNL